MIAMTLEQLVGKYMRLRAELSAAYASLSWNTRQINRLDTEITSTEKAIAEAQPLDEQTSDSFPAFLDSAQEGAAEYRTPFSAGLIPKSRSTPRRPAVEIPPGPPFRRLPALQPRRPEDSSGARDAGRRVRRRRSSASAGLSETS